MPHEEVQSYLSAQPGSDRARAAAWDAVYNVPDDARAQQVIGQLPFPNEVKAVLWDYRAKAATEQEQTPPEGSAAWRFASNMGSQLNPIPMVQGLYGAIRHPIETGTNIVNAQINQGKQAIDLAQQPGILPKIQAVGHGVAAAIPLIGPQAAQAGEQIAAGDVAGGLGKGAGMLAPFAAQKALEMRAASKAATTAPILERQAAQQVSQSVLAPGNPAYRGKAANIAPDILQRGLSGGRDELRQVAVEGMADAVTKLDDAIQATGGAQAPIPVSRVIANLKQSIDELTDSNGIPLSSAAGERINALHDQILRLQAMGGKTGVARFDDLRKIRDESYRVADEARGYQRLGNPVKDVEGWAARETGSAVRSVFAERSPATAAANADYTFFKTLNDVLDPVLGRPKATGAPVGVTGGARTVGAVAGHAIGGKAGAFIFSTVVPWVKDHMASPKWQLASAQNKMRLAAAMKRGDIGTMKSIMLKIGESNIGGVNTPTATTRESQ